MKGNMSELEARRQVTFLKSFERKFAVLHRELERLRKIQTGSGKWSADGLERTVKSLVGAGAVYGLTEVSGWAGETLAVLERIRAKSAVPAVSELEWLAGKIAELESLHARALKRAESILAAPSTAASPVNPAHSPAPKDSLISAGAVSDAAPADSANGTSVSKKPAATAKPATVPKSGKKSVPVTAALFAEDAPHVLQSTIPRKSPPKPLPEAAETEEDFAGSTDTMPVDIIDFVDPASEANDEAADTAQGVDSDAAEDVRFSVPAISSVNLENFAGLAREPRKNPVRRFLWPLIVALLLLALGVSLYFNLSGTSATDEAGTASPAPVATDLKTVVPPAPQSDESVTAPPSVVEPEVDTETEPPESGATNRRNRQPGAGAAKTAGNVPSAKVKPAKVKPEKVKPAGGATSGTSRSGVTSAEKPVAKAPVQPVVTASSASKSGDATGRLRVSAGQGVAGDVLIYVDGEKRGKAPKIISLAPGLHEVKFVANGQEKLKAVSIREGQTRDVTPEF